MKRFSIALVLVGLGCFVAFQMIGSSIADDGTLTEPFFLIPIAWALILLGGILAVATVIKGRIK
jgi:hypothetical protein